MPSVFTDPIDAYDDDDCEDDCGECCDESLHKFPEFGRPHELTWDCWCRPSSGWEDGMLVWEHQVYH